MLEKYKCTAVSHPLLQVIFHGLNVPSMWFSGSKVPQDSLSEMSNLAPHVQCSHKHCYVAHCGMPLSPDPACKCPFYPHSATIPTHSISLWQVRLSCRTQKLPNPSPKHVPICLKIEILKCPKQTNSICRSEVSNQTVDSFQTASIKTDFMPPAGP